jgi:seryl-tRNA synthetase
MLDINLVRKNPQLVKDNEKRRGKPIVLVDKILEADEKWRKELKKVEALKHKRNVVSQEINESKKKDDEKTAKQKIKEMRGVVSEIRKREQKAGDLLLKRDYNLRYLGNIMHPEVPNGKDDSENKEIRKVGVKSKFSFEVKNHVELCEELGIADFEASAKTSGHGFYFLKGELALLNQALIQFAIEFMLSKNYVYVEPPLMLRKEILASAVDMNELAQTVYTIEGENLALIGTSEHSLLGIHANETIDNLPKKYFSYTMCFRKEVGAHGINEKGLWRTHQFNKVEQFIFCKPEESEMLFEELLKNSEEILKKLGLPYRVIEICTGDLSLWKHRSYDLEVYRPTTKAYGEVMSLSNCTDYQARKLGIKLVGKEGREVVHTLNNTALATSRIMVAILENFQTSKGTVKVPKVLQKYMQSITEIGKKNK